MHSFAEEPFTINGVKSWVHCLDCYRNETDDKMKVQNYHYHDYIEFLYALDADMNVWINGSPYRMISGDLIIINSDELHVTTFNRNSRYICVKFSPRVLYFDDNSLFEFKYVTPFLSTSANQKLFCRDDFDEIDIQSLCLEILDEWNSHRPAFELSIRANILKIFMGIFRYWEKETLYHTESVMTENIKKALLYILKHYDSVTESDVAEISGLSYNHFSTAFKKSVGRSFRDYVTLIRLTEAEKLIISSDKDVTEIAYSCGFSSTSHFISIFKKLKGVTPRTVAKKSKANCDVTIPLFGLNSLFRRQKRGADRNLLFLCICFILPTCVAKVFLNNFIVKFYTVAFVRSDEYTSLTICTNAVDRFP